MAANPAVIREIDRVSRRDKAGRPIRGRRQLDLSEVQDIVRRVGRTNAATITESARPSPPRPRPTVPLAVQAAAARTIAEAVQCDPTLRVRDIAPLVEGAVRAHSLAAMNTRELAEAAASRFPATPRAVQLPGAAGAALLSEAAFVDHVGRVTTESAAAAPDAAASPFNSPPVAQGCSSIDANDPATSVEIGTIGPEYLRVAALAAAAERFAASNGRQASPYWRR